MRVAFVIPAHNEATRIGQVIADIAANLTKPQEAFVVIVDDGSRDKTVEVARAALKKEKLEGKVLCHKVNTGKGGAAKTGCDAALRVGADYLVLMDGDGQHRAEDAVTLVNELRKSKVDSLIIGARPFVRTMPFMMRLGNATLRGMSRLFFGITTQDTQSGLRAFSAKTYTKIRWTASNYAMETEMLVLAALARVPVVEHEIATIYHEAHKGTTPLDGLRILQHLVTWKIQGRQMTCDPLHTYEETEITA